MGIFLERDLTPVEAWSFLYGVIVFVGATVDYLPIIDWLRFALTRKSGIDQPSRFAISWHTAPLAYGDLTCHCHQVLTCHLLRINPALQRVKGLLIATHIEDMLVEMIRTQEDKTSVIERVESKGVPDLLGKNLTYLLRLCQVAYNTSLPPMWKILEEYPKCQQFTTLHHTFDDTARRLGVQETIIGTPSLLKISLALGFHLNCTDDL